MNELQIFNNPQFGEIRTTEVNGKTHFVASDIAKALKYQNASKAIKDHCRWVTKCYIPHPQSKSASIEVNVIPEGDIYRLVTHSELPAAEEFEGWIFDEVIPTIRRTGAYSIPNLTPTTQPRYRSRMIGTAIRDIASTAKAIMKLFAVKPGIAQATAFEMVETAYGVNLAPVKKLIQPAEHSTGYLSATEIGLQRGGKSGKEVNLVLQEMGLQVQEVGAKGKKVWRLTEEGKKYGEEMPYKRNGHSGYQIKWNENLLPVLESKEGVAR